MIFAYLFGSQATGRAHRLSDVDIAVYLDDSISPESYLDRRLSLAEALSTRARAGDVEVVVLNDAPLPLAGRIVRDRTVLYSRDEPARVRYESLTLRMFFDFEIHARPLALERLRSIAEGRR